jgi:hypothetical protein
VRVYFAQGAHEAPGRVEPFQEWFGILDAPSKDVIELPASGHRPLFEQPDEFIEYMNNTGLARAAGDDIGWSGPSDELFQWWLDQERASSLSLYGRKLWETMSSYWPTGDQQPNAYGQVPTDQNKAAQRGGREDTGQDQQNLRRQAAGVEAFPLPFRAARSASLMPQL